MPCDPERPDTVDCYRIAAAAFRELTRDDLAEGYAPPRRGSAPNNPLRPGAGSTDHAGFAAQSVAERM
jgi:hypothetical protein